MNIQTNKTATIGQLVVENPGTDRIFQQFGLDFCCGGGKTLEQACQAKGIDVRAVLKQLDELGAAGNEPAEPWKSMSIKELTDRIVQTYHNPLREDLSRICAWLNKVIKVHGETHPDVIRLGAIYSGFRAALEMHMQKEELVLFPMCVELETAEQMPTSHCGTVANPIRVMMAEHEDAGSDLAAMRKLTNDFTPPADACNTFRALYDALGKLEADMHQHVHEENNILFPRAAKLEERFSSCSA